jgi:hypothetical protein
MYLRPDPAESTRSGEQKIMTEIIPYDEDPSESYNDFSHHVTHLDQHKDDEKANAGRRLRHLSRVTTGYPMW